MSWKDALYLLRAMDPAMGCGFAFFLRCFFVVGGNASGNGVNVTSGKSAEPGWPAKSGKRLKSPLLMLLSCVPPTQIWPPSVPPGTIAIADTRLRGPCPEFCVSHVVVSAGIANTVATLFCA